jgi:glycosyltransferase involved in cell wall biosynthesis
MTYWIVNPFDELPNEMGSTQRFWNLARELASRGHKVVWWSMDFSHRQKAKRCPCPATDGVEIKLIKVSTYKKNIGIARIISHVTLGAGFYKQAYLIISKLPKQELTIVLSMPPLDTCYSALRLKSIFPGVRVVIDIMDAWPDVLVEVLCRRARILKPVARKILTPYYAIFRQIVSKADGITAVNQEFIKMVKSSGYVGVSKVVYSGCELIPLNVLNEKWSKMRCGNEKKIKIAYVGAMGRMYDLHSVYKAIRSLNEDGLDIELEIAGGNSTDQKLQSELSIATGVGSRAFFHGFLGMLDLQKMLLRCHIGIIPMFRESLVAFPYKARDYAGAGLPMINSLGWDIEQLIEKYNAGWQYEAGNPVSLAKAIRKAAQSNEVLIDKSIGSRRLADECFDKVKNYTAWCIWLEQVKKNN